MMRNKIWKSIKITNHCEQELLIQPTPEFDGLEICFENLENPKYTSQLFYINSNELPVIIETLQEMLEYTEKQNRK